MLTIRMIGRNLSGQAQASGGVVDDIHVSGGGVRPIAFRGHPVAPPHVSDLAPLIAPPPGIRYTKRLVNILQPSSGVPLPAQTGNACPIRKSGRLPQDPLDELANETIA